MRPAPGGRDLLAGGDQLITAPGDQEQLGAAIGQQRGGGAADLGACVGEQDTLARQGIGGGLVCALMIRASSIRTVSIRASSIRTGSIPAGSICAGSVRTGLVCAGSIGFVPVCAGPIRTGIRTASAAAGLSGARC
ncbi:hypothetical protein [Nocardia amikacinitolerans]|uniref:hypothetical protein n=1 Tax=Nocardia amikacinitolerans TaxID=756689 RepID=UPI001FE8E163|nr:hypothetical protein [Nocardia amikacinitolerans]